MLINKIKGCFSFWMSHRWWKEIQHKLCYFKKYKYKFSLITSDNLSHEEKLPDETTQQLKLVWNSSGSWRGFLHCNHVPGALASAGEKENNILAIECPFLINNIKLSACNMYTNLCISRNSSLVSYCSWLNFILQPLPSPGERNKPKQTTHTQKTFPFLFLVSK